MGQRLSMLTLYKQITNKKSQHFRACMLNKLYWFWLEYNSLNGAMVRVWGEISIDKFGVFLSLLSSTYTESRSFLLLTPPSQ